MSADEEASDLRKRLKETTAELEALRASVAGGISVAKEVARQTVECELEAFARINQENSVTINTYRNMLVALRERMVAASDDPDSDLSGDALRPWIASIDQVVPRG